MMRGRATRCVLVLLAPLCSAAAGGGPTLQTGSDGWRVGNAHYRVELSKAGGGLVARLADASGHVLLDRFELYTDVGLYGERRYYGSRHETQARVTTTRRGEALVVVSEGRLLREADGKPDYPLVRYRVELTFDASASIRVAAALTPEFAAEPSSAFVAQIVGLADAPELFALTDDGLLCQDASAHSTRTWQSRADPLDARRPLFGACTSRGTCVAFTDIRSRAGLANVFVHESGRKSLVAFFAWRDGPGAAPVAKGKSLDLAYTIRLLKSPDELSALLR
jgi:hypothetical protein